MCKILHICRPPSTSVSLRANKSHSTTTATKSKQNKQKKYYNSNEQRCESKSTTETRTTTHMANKEKSHWIHYTTHETVHVYTIIRQQAHSMWPRQSEWNVIYSRLKMNGAQHRWMEKSVSVVFVMLAQSTAFTQNLNLIFRLVIILTVFI